MNGVGHTANIAWVPPIAEGRMQSSQGDLFDPEVTRALLDQLLTDSRLYRVLAKTISTFSISSFDFGT